MPAAAKITRKQLRSRANFRVENFQAVMHAPTVPWATYDKEASLGKRARAAIKIARGSGLGSFFLGHSEEIEFAPRVEPALHLCLRPGRAAQGGGDSAVPHQISLVGNTISM